MHKNKKNIIFDLGAVMVDWNPSLIASNFTNDKKKQQLLIDGLFHHETWIKFDNGKISETEVIERSSKNLNLSIDQTSDLIYQAKESLHAKKDMVALLKLAKEHQLNTYCLSNLSHEWFQHLTKRHDFFNLFDGKVISAQEGIGKPNIEIYQRLLNRYKVNVRNALFIDDRKENTEAAKSLGINSITFQHSKENLESIKQYILNDNNF